ncbi:MAG: hypothetical protein QNJ84_18165 [Alphaproteobacteria bacterium]|nr:hypothetical protein [Alphaproteobacteria bacterium]
MVLDRRSQRLLGIAASLIMLFQTGLAAAEGDARVLTKSFVALSDSATLSLSQLSDSELNRRILPILVDELEFLDRAAPDDGLADLELRYDLIEIGETGPRDNRILTLQGTVNEDADANLKLWSSGGGSSLFQGRTRDFAFSRGYRLSAEIRQGPTLVWQGYVEAAAPRGDAIEVLSPMVQVLLGRMESTVDEIVRLF